MQRRLIRDVKARFVAGCREEVGRVNEEEISRDHGCRLDHRITEEPTGIDIGCKSEVAARILRQRDRKSLRRVHDPDRRPQIAASRCNQGPNESLCVRDKSREAAAGSRRHRRYAVLEARGPRGARGDIVQKNRVDRDRRVVLDRLSQHPFDCRRRMLSNLAGEGGDDRHFLGGQSGRSERPLPNGDRSALSHERAGDRVRRVARRDRNNAVAAEGKASAAIPQAGIDRHRHQTVEEVQRGGLHEFRCPASRRGGGRSCRRLVDHIEHGLDVLVFAIAGGHDIDRRDLLDVSKHAANSRPDQQIFGLGLARGRSRHLRGRDGDHDLCFRHQSLFGLLKRDKARLLLLDFGGQSLNNIGARIVRNVLGKSILRPHERGLRILDALGKGGHP